MKIVLLASISSAHTIKWANGLHEKGWEVLVIGLNNSFDASQYFNNIKLLNIPLPEKILSSDFGSHKKLIYIKALHKIKKIIREFNPQILHAHYASSYGILGALTGFHPYIVSIWGADIFSFPQRSKINKMLIKYVLKRADKILSTSGFMEKEIKKYTLKNIIVTPFGIDTEKFKPKKVASLFKPKDIIIGTIKGLEPQYGVEYLIKAFKIVTIKYPTLPLKLLIIGKGSLEMPLKAMIKELKIENQTIFTGFVKYSEIQNYHNMLDIYLALSVLNDESFGVAILEAGATERPVIVSEIGGLTEVVENNVTGIIVPPRNPEKAAEAIEYLINNPDTRFKMGKSARERILRKYDFKVNLEQMLGIYEQYIV